MKDLSIYIHIPFCYKKCHYCDFLSFSNKNNRIDEYIDALLVELELYSEKVKDYTIKTIFIGGGTPSAIDPKYISTILEYIRNNYNMYSLVEISIEVNPGTISCGSIELYKNSGINRVSIGVQSLNDKILYGIGRIHTNEDFYKTFELVRNAGIDNINVDLMFGLPDQTLDDVISSLERIIELNVEHISYYGLIIEEGTVLYDLYYKGKLNLPSEKVERYMYKKIINVLKENGYNHYEISNFSRPGYKCKHNLTYWDVKPYLGVGLNSHSNMEGKRFFNTSDMDNYIQGLKNNILPVDESVLIDKKTQIEEFCILALRKIDGIDKNVFKVRFNVELEELYKSEINKHVKNGLLKEDKDKVCLTSLGLDLSNIVEVDFLK